MRHVETRYRGVHWDGAAGAGTGRQIAGQGACVEQGMRSRSNPILWMVSCMYSRVPYNA